MGTALLCSVPVNMFSLLIVLLALPALCQGQVYGFTIHESSFDCAGKQDGLAAIGCDGKVDCVNGQAVKTFCAGNEFFDRDTLSCIKTADNSTGCSNFNVCKSSADGRYPDFEKNCQSFYTCYGHNFYGHEYCPGALLFHVELQLCDWAANVPFPCGTHKGPTVG